MVNTLATAAAVLRLGLRVDKYVMWGGLALALHLSRPHLVLAEGDGKSVGLRVAVMLALTAVLLGIGKKRIDSYKKVGRPGAGMMSGRQDDGAADVNNKAE